jgi:hypothetical protein
MCGGRVEGVSVAGHGAVSGLSRRFWPVSLTTRMRSTVGLKSKPKLVPDRAGVNGTPTATAATGRRVQHVEAAVLPSR